MSMATSESKILAERNSAAAPPWSKSWRCGRLWVRVDAVSHFNTVMFDEKIT